MVGESPENREMSEDRLEVPAVRMDEGESQKKKKLQKRRKGRGSQKPFPTMPLEQTLELANAIQEYAGGQKARRLTIFDKMGKSPTSSASRNLITNSSKYGITTGSYNADFIELTQDGRIASSAEAPPVERTRVRFKLGISSVEVFNRLYERLMNNKLPSKEILRDYVGEFGVENGDRAMCVDVFIGNAKFLGVLKILSGAERVVPIDQVLEEIAATVPKEAPVERPFGKPIGEKPSIDIAKKIDYSKVCFFIAPIGEEDSENRKHSDMIHASFIERSLEQFDLQLVRADKITQPGMITAQVIQYLLKSRVVVADLSFHNPNVFYELAIRHMTGLPTIHIIRKGDKLPFDLKDFRTITIDTSDKYHLVASLDTYRSEIANFIRQALEGATERNNPILSSNPSLKVAYE